MPQIHSLRLNQHNIFTQTKVQQPMYTTRNRGGMYRKLRACIGIQNAEFAYNKIIILILIIQLLYHFLMSN